MSSCRKHPETRSMSSSCWLNNISESGPSHPMAYLPAQVCKRNKVDLSALSRLSGFLPARSAKSASFAGLLKKRSQNMRIALQAVSR